MPSLWPRTAFGFFAAVLSVLTFHQGMWALLHAFGEMPPPFPVAPLSARFGLPFIVDLCFWGGVWGVLFGLVLPGLPRAVPMWLLGLILGIIAALVGMFLVPALKGLPIRHYELMDYVRSFLINGFWGIGVGLILPLLLPGVLEPV